MVLEGRAVLPLPGASLPAVRTYLGCRPTHCRSKAVAASPAAHVDGSDSPMLVVSSRHDLVPAAQARRMALLLRADGVDVDLVILDGRLHGAELGDAVWPRTLDFLRNQLGGGS